MSEHRLIAVELDQASIGKAEEAVEHERRVAIADLLEANVFEPAGSEHGPLRPAPGHRGSAPGV